MGPESDSERKNRIDRASSALLGDIMEVGSNGALRLSDVDGDLRLTVEFPGQPPLTLSTKEYLEQQARIRRTSNELSDDRSAEGNGDKAEPTTGKPADK